MDFKKKTVEKRCAWNEKGKKEPEKKLHGKYNTETQASKKIKKLGVHKM
jgi:hypothetical protein